MVFWIENYNGLVNLTQRLASKKILCLDTEFMRSNTFYPKLALIQIYNGGHCWLIDAPSIDDLTPLKRLLENPECTLVMHACAEDLEVLRYSAHISPNKIFDTQIAAGLANISYSISYASLLESLTDIRVTKSVTRSNWLARPLSEEQLKYAEDDVVYLERLYEILSNKLSLLGRCSWFQDEISIVIDNVAARESLEFYFERFKGKHRLGALSLNALRRLSYWREKTARLNDKPRKHILSDTILLKLAANLPQMHSDLFSIKDLRAKDIRIFGKTIISEIQKSYGDQEVTVIPSLPNNSANTIVKKLYQCLTNFGESREIPVEILASKKELEVIVRSALSGNVCWPPRLLKGWRVEIVKPIILEFISDIG
ncbi:MAG: hypothetical protein CBC09_07665 [Cellvibrionales bacterium TMED49]|nr:hypothetical protein [Porticoccaceae bacterium]OUU37015.1 MAG: hypothetical protein CBC09_07665 [Cellvibrionales bacterium TMED49]